MRSFRQNSPPWGVASVATNRVIRDFHMPHARILISERPLRWKDAVVARLDYLCKLPVGWNGYHAGPVDFSTAEFALSVLRRIGDADMPAPSIVPGVNGDLQMEWHVARGDIELHIRAPNDVRAWRETAETGEDGEELALTVDFTDVARWLKDLTEPKIAAVATAA